MTASQPALEASTERKAATAQLETGPAGGACVVKIGGDWRLSGPVLAWDGVLGECRASSVRVAPEGLGTWDTSLGAVPGAWPGVVRGEEDGV